MRNIQKTLFLLLLAFVCSCTSDEQLQEISNVKESSKVTAILSDWNIEDSRTTIITGPYPTAPSPVWVTGDSIGIYPDSGGDQLSFRINEGGSKTCSFDGGGWAMKSSSYTAYSPFKRSFYYEDKDALPISMLGQTQNGNDNADHLGTYDIQIAKGNKPEEGSLVFQFNRYVALVRLEITAPKAATWTSVTLESDASFTTEAKMNLALETPMVTPVKTSNSMALKLTDVTTTNDNLSIIAYMMLLPVDLTEKSLSIKLTDSENNIYSSNATITNNKTNFAANAARWISVTFEEEVTNEEAYKDGVVNLTEAGTMKRLLGNDYLNITSLKIIGYINGDDIYNLRKMLGGTEFKQAEKGKLTTLDLSEASIIEGGNWYYKKDSPFATYNTSNNVIGDYMFNECSNLQNILLPNSVISIGKNAFYECTSLKTINLGNEIISIGNSAFWHCFSLTSIDIPNSVTSIGNNAFARCSGLNSIIIPNSVTAIGDYTFESCSGLISVKIGTGITKIGSYIFGSCSTLTSIELSTGITSIGGYAFYGCSSLTSIDIPNSVTYIGYNAFCDCSSLTSIKIPDSVTSISEKTFDSCLSLATIELGTGITYIGEYAFFRCSSLTSIDIPNSVTYIGDNAFRACSSLASIKIPDSVTSIRNSAFYGCSSLTSIKIPDSVTSIKEYTFWGCSSLTSIKIPNSVTSIDNHAFYGCSTLRTVEIGSGVTSIGWYAFISCPALTKLYCYASTPPKIVTGYSPTFDSYEDEVTLYVPKGCGSEYFSSSWGGYFRNIDEIE